MFALLGMVANAAEKVTTSTFEQGFQGDAPAGQIISSDVLTWTVDKAIYVGWDTNKETKKGAQLGKSKQAAGEFTLQTAENFKNVKKVEVYLSVANDGSASVSTFVGETQMGIATDFNNTTPKVYTFEGAPVSGNISFALNGIAKALYVQKVVIYEEENVDPNQVVAPTFSLTSGTYEGTQSLTLNCETEGATIYYTVNGEEALAYTGAIELTAGEYAFVAWAEKDGMTKSSEVTANYKIVAPLVANSIAEFLALGAENADREITLNCDLTVTYQGGTKGSVNRDLYVQDKDGKGLLIFSFDNPQLNKGDVISGVKGKYDFYNGVPELIEPVLGEVKETVEVAPVSVDASQLTVDNVNDYVVINNVELSEVNGANATLNDETATLALYNKYNACTYPEELNKKYFVTGIVSVYKDAVQIYPLEITVDTESGVNDAVANEFKAVAVANGIEVNVAEAGLVSVYNAAGQLVANVNVAEGATTINVAGGFYIVKAGNNVAKVLVK